MLGPGRADEACGVVGKEGMCITNPQSYRSDIKAQGYSIRTHEWRLTEWVPFNTTYYIGMFPKDLAACANVARSTHRAEVRRRERALYMIAAPMRASVRLFLFLALAIRGALPPLWWGKSCKMLVWWRTGAG